MLWCKWCTVLALSPYWYDSLFFPVVLVTLIHWNLHPLASSLVKWWKVELGHLKCSNLWCNLHSHYRILSLFLYLYSPFMFIFCLPHHPFSTLYPHNYNHIIQKALLFLSTFTLFHTQTHLFFDSHRNKNQLYSLLWNRLGLSFWMGSTFLTPSILRHRNLKNKSDRVQI